MINIYNESHLHRTIKNLYATQYEGKTEVSLNGHIYDILGKDGTVVEIQTGNLAKLLPKILDTIGKGHKVVLVHPLVIQKWIQNCDKDGNILSCRKSPKKNTIYNLFDELTGIYPVLLNPHFKLEVVLCNIKEIRQKEDEPVQSANKRRRFKKDWVKTGKELKEILETRTFCTKEDYYRLLPADLENEFCAKDIKNAMKKEGEAESSCRKAHLIIWVFKHMGIIEKIFVKNRSHFYKKC